MSQSIMASTDNFCQINVNVKSRTWSSEILLVQICEHIQDRQCKALLPVSQTKKETQRLLKELNGSAWLLIPFKFLDLTTTKPKLFFDKFIQKSSLGSLVPDFTFTKSQSLRPRCLLPSPFSSTTFSSSLPSPPSLFSSFLSLPPLTVYSSSSSLSSSTSSRSLIKYLTRKQLCMTYLFVLTTLPFFLKQLCFFIKK